MYTPAADAVAGYSSGNMADKDTNQETTLGSAYSPVDYMSITSFPRLPEDDALSGENTVKSRKDDDNFLSEQETGKSRACQNAYQFRNVILMRFRCLRRPQKSTVIFTHIRLFLIM